jgi:hypothetical protein
MAVRQAIQITMLTMALLNLYMGWLMWTIQGDLPMSLTEESFLRSTSDYALRPRRNHHPIRIQAKCGRGGKRCGNDFSMPSVIHDGPSVRRERDSPKRIFFHHIHKCGGTSVCTMAKMNGEVTPHRPDRPDPICFIEPPNHCMTNVEDFVATDSNITFLEFPCARKQESNWQSLNNATKAWTFVTFIRHPLERLLSEFRHFGFLSVKSSNFTTEEQIRDNLDVFAEYASTHTNGLLNWIAPGWRKVRSLTNQTSGGNATDSEIDNAILAFAKQRLEEYDVLVVLEDMTLDCPRFADTMGWNFTAACLIHRNADAARGENAATLLGEERTSEIIKLNAIDMQLYEYGRKLAAKQRIRWQHQSSHR